MVKNIHVIKQSTVSVSDNVEEESISLTSAEELLPLHHSECPDIWMHGVAHHLHLNRSLKQLGGLLAPQSHAWLKSNCAATKIHNGPTHLGLYHKLPLQWAQDHVSPH